MTKLDRTIYIVFFSLLIDLMAFTMILPLFPSLLDYYKDHDTTGLYSWLARTVRQFQTLVGAPEKFNSVLFGGFLGSMFSFLQFLASPIVGAVSDVLGRKRVMVVCLIGISCSYAIWVVSHNIALFILARFIGGISRGNVSMVLAIITDVSSIRMRGKGMAFVGMAFSLGFIIGPLIGALFAVWAKTKVGEWFMVPAVFALVLSIIDIIFIMLCLEETLPKNKRAKNIKTSLESAKNFLYWNDLFNFKAVTQLSSTNLNSLRVLSRIYFVYLFIYSGLEFTLTFLTHHSFNYNSMQQGWMFVSIGIIMAFIQGVYLRGMHSQKTKSTALFGLALIVPSFVCVGLANGIVLLYLGLLLFAVSTAMVVPCIMTLASEYGGEHQKGTVMGIFRSLGALARAIGPIVASVAFWSIGSKITYLIGACGLLWPVITMINTF